VECEATRNTINLTIRAARLVLAWNIL